MDSKLTKARLGRNQEKILKALAFTIQGPREMFEIAEACGESRYRSACTSENARGEYRATFRASVSLLRRAGLVRRDGCCYEITPEGRAILVEQGGGTDE